MYQSVDEPLVQRENENNVKKSSIFGGKNLLILLLGIGFILFGLYEFGGNGAPAKAIGSNYVRHSQRSQPRQAIQAHQTHQARQARQVREAVVVNSKSLGAQNAQKVCGDRKCCTAKNNVNVGSMQCSDLGVIECVSNDDFCEWNCDEHRNKLYDEQIKTFQGFREKLGVFKDYQNGEAEKMGYLPSEELKVNSVEDYIFVTSSHVMDECGVIYKSELREDVASQRFKEMQESPIDSKETTAQVSQSGASIEELLKDPAIVNEIKKHIPGEGDGEGIIKPPDDRIQITTSAWPYLDNGVLLFSTSSGTSRCTATLISRRVLVTAGHCVSSGYSSWYSNFKFYPGVTSSLGNYWWWYQAGTFTAWHSSRNFNYDIGWIRLSATSTGLGWWGFGYNNGFYAGLQFEILGYPADKPAYTHWYQQSVYNYVATYRMGSSYVDTYGGSSGSPVYRWYYVTYCIHSTGGTYNECTRIDQTKFVTLCNFISQGETQLSGC